MLWNAMTITFDFCIRISEEEKFELMIYLNWLLRDREI